MGKKNYVKFNKSDMRLLAIIALLIVAITFIFSATLIPVFAEEYTEISVLNFDNTNVLDELRSAENFDIKQYPINKSINTFIVQNVVEYCYSFDENKRSNYALYLYLYNPSLIEIDTTSYDNKLQLAIGYDTDGKPNNYEKFNLKFCSVSNDADYKLLFYKFKVIDHRSTADNKTIAERVNSNARRYDISGIELLTNGSVLSTDYPVSKTYTFSGYAAGFGPDETNLESTLQCKAEQLNTLKLNVEHTFYRTKTSSKGANHQNQINTVYFSVHKDYFNDYGNLQRIKAEWYEYKTKPVIVTSHKDFYNKALPYMGKKVGEYVEKNYGNGKFNTNFESALGYALYYGRIKGSTTAAIWAWNAITSVDCRSYDEYLYYLLPCDNIENYDPYADMTESGGLGGNDLYNYILTYTKSYDNGRLPIKNGSISADLFESDIDEDRKLDNIAGKIQQGYSYYEFDADLDIKYLNSWQSSKPDFWDNFKEYGLWNALTGNIPQEEAIELSPIKEFDMNDLKLGDNALIDKYYINAKDISSFRAYAKNAQLKGEKVVLFRFATSDYYVVETTIEEGKAFGKEFADVSYMSQGSVFLNFDIIQLTFKNNDIYTVIPVVSSPIDIVPDPTPPTNIKTDSKNILTIILTVILIVVFIFVIVEVVIWLFKTLANPPAKATNTKPKSNKKEHRYKQRRK